MLKKNDSLHKSTKYKKTGMNYHMPYQNDYINIDYLKTGFHLFFFTFLYYI